MLVFHPINRGQAGYYLNGPAPGRWLGSGCRALGLDGEVDAATFSAALGGRRSDGSALLHRIPPNRRAGFDLVFAAPKSVSLLSALAPPEAAGQLVAAHANAVVDAVAYLERVATMTRRGGALVAADGLVAVAFDHRSSWAGDPHLHTHVVVANLVRGPDGRWSCLDRLKLGRESRSAGAVYQASLRHHAAAAGLALGWIVRDNGLSDVAGVPRAAIEACSTRRRQLSDDLPAGQRESARARLAAAGRTRRSSDAGRSAGLAGRSVDGPGDGAAGTWEHRAADAGLDRDTVAALLDGPAPGRGPGPADVERLLTTERSSFSRSELISALAATALEGASSARLEVQADRFLADAISVEGRWTTRRVRQLEDDIVGAATGRGGGGPGSAGVAAPGVVAETLRLWPDLTSAEQAAVVRLTTGGAVVDMLETGPLIRSADTLVAASAAWRASGHRVAVVTTSATDRRRWDALTAVPGPPAPPARPSVTIVDRADRLSTTALHALVDDAARRGAKVVLVPGGTGPPAARPCSPVLDSLAERLGPVLLGPDQPEATRTGRAVAAGRDGTVVVSPTGADAIRRLVDDWQVARADAVPPAMVALGPDEAETLNRLARSRLAGSGDLSGPALQAGGRELREGDEVRVLKSVPRLGLRAGVTGVVSGVDPDRGEALLQWPDRTTVAPVESLAGRWWAHAYATTPAYLRHDAPGPVIALGQPPGWDPDRAGLTTYIVVPERVGRPEGIDPAHLLVASLDPPARSGPCPVGPTLAGLALRQAHLDRTALTGCPPDVRAELRLVQEDLTWRRAAPGPPGPVGATGPSGAAAGLAELGRRHDHLVDVQLQRVAWIEDHREALEQWAGLDAGAAWRADALTSAAELAPTRAVSHLLGPPPQDDEGRHTWRQAAGAIEAYRDRWSLPDHPLPASPARHPEWDRAREADELRVHRICREAVRALGAGRELADQRQPSI